MSGNASDLNLFGCHVDTLKLLTPGTRIRIRIAHNGLIERAPEHLAHAYFPIKCAPPIKTLSFKDRDKSKGPTIIHMGRRMGLGQRNPRRLYNGSTHTYLRATERSSHTSRRN